MASVLLLPLPFTASPSTPAATRPISRAGTDIPGHAWQAPLTLPFAIIDLGPVPVAYDWVALIGTNLRSTDIVQVRTGGTVAGTGSFDSGAQAAWTGRKPKAAMADAIFRLSSTRTERYLRVDVSAPSHPDGSVRAFRLVVGQGVYTPGVTYDAEMGFVDQSIVSTGPDYTFVDDYSVRPTWKVPISWLKEDQWRGDVYDLLQQAGNKRGLLFILDDARPTDWQTDAMYGRVQNNVGGKAVGYDAWGFELQLIGYTP